MLIVVFSIIVFARLSMYKIKKRRELSEETKKKVINKHGHGETLDDAVTKVGILIISVKSMELIQTSLDVQ